MPSANVKRGRISGLSSRSTVPPTGARRGELRRRPRTRYRFPPEVDFPREGDVFVADRGDAGELDFPVGCPERPLPLLTLSLRTFGT
jgi:hypothetical protein